jgi:hypothetical protein
MWGTLLCSTLAIAGCRFGFDELSTSAKPDAFAAPDSSPPGHVTVTVLGEDGETTAGMPIANATVMIAEHDGSVHMFTTAADGSVVAPIDGGTTVHVARNSPELGTWLVYTFAGIGGELAVVAGGHPLVTGSMGHITTTLPPYPDMAFTASTVRGPLRCLVNSDPFVAMPLVTSSFQPGCAGETVKLLAAAAQGTSIEASLYFETTLADMAALDESAKTWSPIEKYKVVYEGLPDTVTMVTVIGLVPGLVAGDFIPFDGSSDTPSAGAVNLYVNGPPFVAGSRYATSMSTANGTLAVLDPIDEPIGTWHFDPTHIVAAPSGVTLDHATGTVNWHLDGTTSADTVALQSGFTSSTNNVRWSAYAPAGTTSLGYPMIPGEPGAITLPADATWAMPNVEQIRLSDFNYVQALGFIDRDLPRWLDDGSNLPTGTLSLAFSTGTVARIAPQHQLLRLVAAKTAN